MKSFSIDQTQIPHETMRRRINSRCKGLLEVGSVRGSGGNEEIPSDIEILIVYRKPRDSREASVSNEVTL
jgi:hypothetical protein